MRQGQFSKQRSRGRSNNRKGVNPLTKTFDSNGPDVKIRGTALHIAEKYAQLSRDATSSGDRVMAENYLQHAEHYYRIIADAQGPSFSRDSDRDDDYDGDGRGEGFDPGQAEQPYSQPDNRSAGEGRGRSFDQNGNRNYDRGNGNGQDRPSYGDNRNNRGERGDRNDRPERSDRNDRGDRPERGERNDRMTGRGNRNDRGGRPPFRDRNAPQPAAEAGSDSRGETRPATPTSSQPMPLDAPQPFVDVPVAIDGMPAAPVEKSEAPKSAPVAEPKPEAAVEAAATDGDAAAEKPVRRRRTTAATGAGTGTTRPRTRRTAAKKDDESGDTAPEVVGSE